MKNGRRTLSALLPTLLLCLALLPGVALASDTDILTPPDNPGELVAWLQGWEALLGGFGTDTYTPADSLTYEVVDNQVIIKGCAEDLDRLAVPAVIDGCPVTGIDAGAFAGRNLYFAILPNSIQSIGANAFSGCTKLHTLSVPFVGASRSSAGTLSHFGVSDALLQLFVTDATAIGNSAFSGCANLKSIVFKGDNAVSMGGSAFKGCTGLEVLELPEGLTSVGSYAFQNCTNFKSFTVPDSVQTIGTGAFSGCSSLESLTLPFIGRERGITENTEAVFGYVFGGYTYEGGAKIDQWWNGSNQVSYCIPAGLTSVTVTDETVIGHGAFSNYTWLESLSYPLDKITQIDGQAFSNCAKLTSLPIPPQVTVLRRCTFEGCTGLAEHPVIPAAVTAIESDAFLDCTSFQTLSIPETVQSIGSGAFRGCSGLKSVTLPFIGKERGNTETSEALFGYIFGGYTYEGGTKIDQWWNGSNQVSYVIPAGLTSVTVTDETVIGHGAFSNYAWITSLSYPLDKITQVDGQAFSNCAKLTSLPIPPQVTVLRRCTFEGCTGLAEHPVIPAAVTAIESDAFLDCTSFQTLSIPETVQTIGSGAFRGCSGLKSVTLPFIGKERGNTETSEALFGYIFGGYTYEGGTKIDQWWNGSNQVSYCIPAGLTSVTVTDETVIGHGAFSNYAWITSLSYPLDKVAQIGGQAFEGCKLLTSLPIPPAVTVLANRTFAGCTGLTVQPEIPAAVTTIKENAFLDCTALTALNIPKTVKIIEGGAFRGCSGLTGVTLPFIGRERGITEMPEALFGYVFGGANYEGAAKVTAHWNPSNQITYYIPAALTTATITDEPVVGYCAFENCAGVAYTVSAPLLYYADVNGRQATLESAASSGLSVMLRLDETLAAKQPKLCAVVYDKDGRMVYVGTWDVTETEESFVQKIALPKGVAIGKIQTMLVGSTYAPLIDAFRLTE